MDIYAILNTWIETVTNELFCVDNHTYFRQVKAVYDRFQAKEIGEDVAKSEIGRIFQSANCSWAPEAKSWFREQFGWICCLSTTLDGLRPMQDYLRGFKDLDQCVHNDFAVFIFVEDLC